MNNPRCFYDAPSGRWFLTATSQDGRNAPRRVALSVSAGSDPTRGWRRYLLNTPTTLEQPSFNSVALGVYPEALVIAGNL